MYRTLKKAYKYLFLLVCFICFVVCARNSFAASISWSPVTAEGSYPVTGYKLYYGDTSGDHNKSFDVGNVTSYDLSNITPSLTLNQQYYFVVVAYTSIGEEGFFSNEIGVVHSEDGGGAIQYGLTAQVIGQGTVSPTSGVYNEGAVVNLVSSPSTGFVVKEWNGTNDDLSTANTNSVTMNNTTTVSVEFEPISGATFQLTASVSGGNGSVTPNSGTYNSGTIVSMIATPNSGYCVKAWQGSDNDSSTSNNNVVTLTDNKSITVEFEAVASDLVKLISEGEEWKYFKGTSQPGQGWSSLSFDDSSWLEGPTGIGYSDGDDATILSDMQGGYLTVYTRKTKKINNPSAIGSIILDINYDDGFVAYINGQEVARSSMPDGLPTFNTAAYNHEAGVSTTFDLSQHINHLVSGNNVFAVEVHNATLGSSDCTLIPEILVDYAEAQTSVPSAPVLSVISD